MSSARRQAPSPARRRAPSVDRLVVLRSAALSTTYVSLGNRRTTSPHEFYRYPARFPPAFARSAIEAFTNVGDLVLDPFVGGGTTVLEAMLSGRRSIGSDVNSLATFVTRVKTTALDDVELFALKRWTKRLPTITRDSARAPVYASWDAAGYFKDLDDTATIAIRVVAAKVLGSVPRLPTEAAREFARCVLLRTAQWALDMRRDVPSAEDFQVALGRQAEEMLRVAEGFADVAGGLPVPNVLTQPLPGLSEHLLNGEEPRLILTSPPYPGVYVIYHRWKLRGRREIPAPYWIANQLDGKGMARYTMGARSDPERNAYFENLADAFSDLAEVAGPATTLVQMVGFNGGRAQLKRYLSVMVECGFEEVRFPALQNAPDGRLWRGVPNRRWWNEAAANRDNAVETAREVVLVHRLAR